MITDGVYTPPLSIRLTGVYKEVFFFTCELVALFHADDGIYFCS